jgi:hypothetical protein
MSGSVYSSMLQNSSRLAFILWKFIFNSLKLFLLTGYFFCLVGDEVHWGGPMFVVLWIESFIDVDVSFKFDDKLYVCISKSSNKFVLKFGRPQLQQYQLASDCSSGSYITVFIWRQFLWYHFSPPVQAIERIVRDHLHALPHILHGYFTDLGVIGPGFGWQSDAFYYMWIKKQIWLKYGFRDLLQLIIQIVDKSVQTLSIFPIYFIEKNNF